MPLQMRMGTEADTDAIARLATVAFDPATDAIARNLFPQRLQPAVPRPEDPAIAWRRTRKGIKMATERIILMVVTDDQLDGQVVGFSMWEEPLPEGQSGGSAGEGQLVPCETLDEAAYEELRRATGQATKDFLGEDGSKHMWYLDYLGVDPGQQRRGIGKMLLNWGLEKAREQNRDAYLIATPAGIPLYQAAGFEDLGSFMLFDTPHHGMIIRRPAP